MPKKRKRRHSGQTDATISADIGIFKKPKPVRGESQIATKIESEIHDIGEVHAKKSKILKEERALRKILREMFFDEIKEDLKKDPGEEYTDQDAENVFELFIQDAKKSGLIKKILDNYLKEKIKSERGENSDVAEINTRNPNPNIVN